MSGRLPVVEVDALGFDEGAHVLVKLALGDLEAGELLGVRGSHPELCSDLATWCRQNGHRLVNDLTLDGRADAVIERGTAAAARWVGAQRAGHADPSLPDAVAPDAPPHWGLAARGAAIEAGGPASTFRLSHRDEIWTERAPRLYAQAAGAQWDPATAIDWDAPIDHDHRVEAAVVQVMTYLVENEEAALVVPARFVGHIHPHFREIQQVLAITVADEARHIDVFTRRATMTGHPPALSSAGGHASLQTLLDEPDFATASFLLSVMGEGTFVSLLGFLERHAPDPVTQRIAQLTRHDEARHVAFAMSHLEHHVRIEPDLRDRLARAVERRHHALQSTAGLNDEVFDALVLLAGGSTVASDVATGWRHVQELQRDMAEARSARLARLGFTPAQAETLAALHTRNFM